MSQTVALSCSCGAVKGELKLVPGAFFHVHCLCCDCQRFASHLQNSDKILDSHGGTELLQTYPQFMAITQGQDKVACVQFGSSTKGKGLFRWHTSCCNMPLANTMNSAKVPFVGISATLMQFSSEDEKLAILGPVTMKAFGQYSIGEMPKDTHAKFPLSFMPKILGFMLKGMFTGKSSPSPFFKEGEPVVKPNRLT